MTKTKTNKGARSANAEPTPWTVEVDPPTSYTTGGGLSGTITVRAGPYSFRHTTSHADVRLEFAAEAATALRQAAEAETMARLMATAPTLRDALDALTKKLRAHYEHEGDHFTAEVLTAVQTAEAALKAAGREENA